MAKIHDVGSGVKFYSISHAVGEGMPNSKDDVLLVQWLLKQHFDRPDKKQLLGRVWQIHALTGTCTPELVDIIKIYQYDANLNVRGARYKLDGKIYPLMSGKALNENPLPSLNLSVAGHSKYYKTPSMTPGATMELKQMFERCGSV